MTDTITLEVNNNVYENFDEIKVSKSIKNPCGSFSFSTTASLKDNLPIRAGDLCAVKINNVPVIKGFIDSIDASYSINSHGITISGRDLMADLIDSSIGPDLEFKGPITLVDLFRQTIKHMGLNLSVTSQVSDIEPISEEELVSAEFDVKGFDFLSKYATLRQVFVYSSGTGGLIITRGAGGEPRATLQNVVGSLGNNIKSAQYRDSRQDRYNKYSFTAQLSPVILDDQSATAEAIEAANASISEQTSSITDAQIRATRKLFLKAEESSSSVTMEERAQWESNIRKARGRTYTATLTGFKYGTGALQIWFPNMLVYVNDDLFKLKEKMLVWSVNYSLSTSGGSEVMLECVQHNLLSLEATKPPKGEL